MHEKVILRCCMARKEGISPFPPSASSEILAWPTVMHDTRWWNVLVSPFGGRHSASERDGVRESVVLHLTSASPRDGVEPSECDRIMTVLYRLRGRHGSDKFPMQKGIKT